MPYTDEEKGRLQRLTETEATLIDLAKYTVNDPLFGAWLQKTIAMNAIRRYAAAESLSLTCQMWLTEIQNSMRPENTF